MKKPSVLRPLPTCSQISEYRPVVEQALHDYYNRWPYNSTDHFLQFPELRQTLLLL